MTMLFVDGFDHYATADITLKWSSITVGSPTIQSASGRRGTGCLRGGTLVGIRKTFASAATLVVGFAYKYVGALSAGRICSFEDSGSAQVSVHINSDGTLKVVQGASTNLGSSSAAALSAGTWYYIEFKATISDAAGTYEIKINGVTAVSGSSVDTKATANATANSLIIGGIATVTSGGGATSTDYDDVYLLNSSGSVNNDFLGDVRVDAYLPSGAGNTTQWTASAGSNYQCVDESPQNGDTDYVQTSTVNNKDTYAFADMTHTPSNIYAVQINAIAKKDDAGTRSICLVTRSGGSDTDGATQALSAASYSDFTEVRETDPNTSAAWTKTNFNSAEFGIKLVA